MAYPGFAATGRAIAFAQQDGFTLSCQLDGLALQSSSLNGKSLTLNYLNTASGVHQLDFANARLYNALGKKPDFNKLYLGTANAEQLDAGSSGLSVDLFGSGGADTLIESCVQISRNSSDALLKFDLSGAGAFNSNALSIQLSGIYTRQTSTEVTLRSLMYGLQADAVI